MKSFPRGRATTWAKHYTRFLCADRLQAAPQGSVSSFYLAAQASYREFPRWRFSLCRRWKIPRPGRGRRREGPEATRKSSSSRSFCNSSTKKITPAPSFGGPSHRSRIRLFIVVWVVQAIQLAPADSNDRDPAHSTPCAGVKISVVHGKDPARRYHRSRKPHAPQSLQRLAGRHQPVLARYRDFHHVGRLVRPRQTAALQSLRVRFPRTVDRHLPIHVLPQRHRPSLRRSVRLLRLHETGA